MFYLSGAINALLLLVARPQLLLLTRPKVDGQHERQPTPQSHEVDGQPERQPAPQRHEVNGQPEMELTPRTSNAANAAVSDTPHSPEPTATALLDAGSSNNTAITRVSSQVSI